MLSVCLKSFEELCSELSKIRAITNVRWEIIPEFGSSTVGKNEHLCAFILERGNEYGPRSDKRDLIANKAKVRFLQKKIYHAIVNNY